MDFTDLYFALESDLGDGAIFIPILPNFNLDVLVEGSFFIATKEKPKQEIIKHSVINYIAEQKDNGKDIRLVVLLPHDERSAYDAYDSPLAVKTDRMFYDYFPESLDCAIIYCIERSVFDSLYGKTVIKSRETAFS